MNSIDNKDAIILDFFAGSGTTAQAVEELNKEDGGNRKYILVQLPEKCEESSSAVKAGYETIAEISKDRIRKYIETREDKDKLGFKVLKQSKSTLHKWRDFDPKGSQTELIKSIGLGH